MNPQPLAGQNQESWIQFSDIYADDNKDYFKDEDFEEDDFSPAVFYAYREVIYVNFDV